VVELVVAPVGGWGSEEREREGNCRNGGSTSWFFAEFAPDFILSQAINGDSIYRRWKRVISSSPG
jgi:hypothetical protein